VKTAITSSTAWSLPVVCFLPVGPAWEEEPEAGLAELAGMEHGELVTSDTSPVGAHLIEGETSYVSLWSIPRRGVIDYSAPFETHAFGVGVTYGIVDDVDVSVHLGYPTVFDGTYNYDVADSIGGPASGFVSLIARGYRIMAGLQYGRLGRPTGQFPSETAAFK